MLGLLHTLEFIVSIIISSAYNTILSSSQPHATVVAAAAQTISSQTDNDLTFQCKRFQHQLDQAHILLAKKLRISRSYRIYEKKLEEIEKNFQALQAEYEQHSPATVILGPIGAIATVLKEQKISNNLVKYLQELANIFAQIADQAKEQNLQIFLNKSLEKALDQLDSIIDNSDDYLTSKKSSLQNLVPRHP